MSVWLNHIKVNDPTAPSMSERGVKLQVMALLDFAELCAAVYFPEPMSGDEPDTNYEARSAISAEIFTRLVVRAVSGDPSE